MNVIVFALNGCPVSALGPYGNEWVATPYLDRLAAEGVVFDAHVSDSPDPDAARRAWLTGRHQVPPLPSSPLPFVGEGPGARGELTEPASNPLTPQPPLPAVGEGEPNQDLLARLHARGVRTVLVRHTREPNDAHPEFYAGWGERFDARPDPNDLAPTDALVRALPAVLDRLADAPAWLLWIELDQLLPPWYVPQHVFDAYIMDLTDLEADEEDEDEDEESDEAEADVEDEEDSDDEDDVDEEDEDEDPDPEPPAVPVEPWTDPPVGWFDADDLASWELLHRSFAAAVSVFDARLGEVLDLLRERRLDTSAAWVLTADRGFPLGEHGIVGPSRPWLYEELVHVPLIVRLPEAAEAGRRVSAFTQPADLMPTLAEWLGADAAADHGASLVPLLYGRAEAVREYAVSGLATDSAAEWAIRTPEWAYLLPDPTQPEGDEPRPPKLFEKPDDRWGVNDLSSRHVERCEELEKLLRDVVGRMHQPGPFAPPPLESGGGGAE